MIHGFQERSARPNLLHHLRFRLTIMLRALPFRSLSLALPYLTFPFPCLPFPSLPFPSLPIPVPRAVTASPNEEHNPVHSWC